MRENEKKTAVVISVPDPDPYVFGLPGSVITSTDPELAPDPSLF
jgi:hypothetical protein